MASDFRILSGNSVEMAIHRGNVSVYALLLEYGAPTHAPYRSLRPNRDIAQCKEIIRLALEYDGSNAKMDEAGSDIFYLCNLLAKRNNLSPNEMEDCLCIVEMLLQHGSRTNHFENERQTPLDMVQASNSIPPELQERLTSALRLHGGLTYKELSAKKEETKTNEQLTVPVRPTYPKSFGLATLLENEPLAIDPMFNHVVDFLKSSIIQTGYFRVSNRLAGFTCPVLVVESGYPEQNGNYDIVYRKTIKMHRRTGSTSWNQQSDDFELPVKERLVFTPPGVVIPSRVDDDMPKFLLDEVWLSLPDCECYYEANPVIQHDREFGGNLFAWAKKTGIDSTNIIKNEVKRANGFHFHSISKNTQLWPYKITQADRLTLESATQASKEAGLEGEWHRILGRQGLSEYAFTTHGQNAEGNLGRRCPYPNEIFCYMDVSRPEPGAFFRKWAYVRPPKLKTTTKISLESQEGISYWNYASVCTPKFRLSIFFGDEVSPSTVEKLQKSMLRQMR